MVISEGPVSWYWLLDPTMPRDDNISVVEVIIPVESVAPIEIVERFAANEIGHWFDACDQFLKWERAHMLLSDPSPETTKQHRAVLSLLLRFIRAMHQEA